jgi:hypothetical protein
MDAPAEGSRKRFSPPALRFANGAGLAGHHIGC